MIVYKVFDDYGDVLFSLYGFSVGKMEYKKGKKTSALIHNGKRAKLFAFSTLEQAKAYCTNRNWTVWKCEAPKHGIRIGRPSYNNTKSYLLDWRFYNDPKYECSLPFGTILVNSITPLEEVS